MNILPGVKAYFDAITHKFQVENHAEIIELEQVLGIQYPQMMTQPWPRAFNYRLEFFSGENPPSQVKNQILAYLQNKPEEHVVNIFSEKLNQLIPAYRDQGYLHAWSNILMFRKLPLREKNTLPSGVEIKLITTIQDVSLANSIEPDYPCSTKGLDDPTIHNLMAFFQGEVCAKAQVITLPGKFAYIADIFTHPDFRRKGISTTLLQEMNQIALGAGNSMSILVPSKMTREFDLFQKFSYQILIEMALLVPDQTDH
ncbi:MAG: GNAT family N-acetyltransferase [Anaerolineaceae bacterium]|nr:GNAT family N-acetyltransferase [Anaerolineaceae bacterium]